MEALYQITWQAIDVDSLINLISAGDFNHLNSWVILEMSFTLPLQAAFWNASRLVYVAVSVSVL